jgi:inosine-uridine nucleoside N-ribohydrolase
VALIIETDLGHDPDDFFALCYLSNVADIRAILLTPGHPHQVAIANFLVKELGLKAKVGVPEVAKKKDFPPWSKGINPGRVHGQILSSEGYPLEATAEHCGSDLIDECLKADPNTEFFICGPLTNVGSYLTANPGVKISRVTMQGGFIGYHTHGLPVQRLEKFEGKDTVATFNLNGNVRGGLALLDANVADRRFVSKNVCHTLVYDEAIHMRMLKVRPKTRGDELLRRGMYLYLGKHHEGKKFHDPSAAVAHIHPEIVTWFEGRLYRQRGEWGTWPDPKLDKISVDIDREALWNHIANGD